MNVATVRSVRYCYDVRKLFEKNRIVALIPEIPELILENLDDFSTHFFMK